MGNGYTTTFRAQWITDSDLTTHNVEFPVPTVLGMVVIGSVVISLIELWRSFK